MKRTKIIVAIAIFGLTFNVGAQNATDQGNGFYERKSEGWFWYETEPEEKSMGSDSNQSSLTLLISYFTKCNYIVNAASEIIKR